MVKVVEFICRWCGKPRFLAPVIVQGEHKFCRITCYNNYMRYHGDPEYQVRKNQTP